MALHNKLFGKENQKRNTIYARDIIYHAFNEYEYGLYYLLFLHYFCFGFISFLGVTLFPVRSFIFLYAFIVITIKILINIYCRGCILIKAERCFLGKDWVGFPHNVLFWFLEREPTTHKVNTVFILATTIICIYILSRLKLEFFTVD